jgi:hypothetical protein
MNQAERASPDLGATLRADLSAVEIDIRCALVLARIALQTLADATPENHVRILNALDDAMDSAKLEEGDNSGAVVGLLTDFKQRLADTADETKVWYLED